MKIVFMGNNTVFFSSAITGLVLATSLATAYARNGDEFSFLLRLHPKVSTAMVVTGPEHVERVMEHSLVFSPEQTHNVLPKLDRMLTKRHGWTRLVLTPGEYVDYEHGGTNVSYMSDKVYRHLNWPDGTKPLPIKKGGCVVEYFQVTYKRHNKLSGVGIGRKTRRVPLGNRLTGIQFPSGTRSTYTHSGGDGLRRSALEAGGVLTTFIWDGNDYLMEKS